MGGKRINWDVARRKKVFARAVVKETVAMPYKRWKPRVDVSTLQEHSLWHGKLVGKHKRKVSLPVLNLPEAYKDDV